MNAPVERGRRGDEYAERYMKGDGAPLWSERTQPAAWYHALFLAPAAVLAATPFVVGAPWWFTMPGVAVLAVSWALMSVLRVSVTQGAVHVQLGPLGPSIPTAGIESVEVVDVKGWKHGFGVHLLLDGTWAYTLPVKGARGVEIVWRNAKGKKKSVVVSSRTPHLLVDAIARARRGEGTADLEAVRAAHDVRSIDGDDATGRDIEVAVEVENEAQRRK